MSRVIPGIHHITAIESDPRRNLHFYTDVLGLRLVKRTVNFDDPGTYHFYFGNAEGAPGSILTFFPWPHATRGTVGNGQVTATTFAVPAASLDYWRARLEANGAAARDAGSRFGEAVLAFEDPDGMRLELIGTPLADPSRAWRGGTVAAEHAICGFHSATLAEEGYEKTARLVADVMGFQPIGAEGNRFRYAAAAGSHAGSIVDILCAPDRQRGRQGAGTVHHIAWRTADETEQLAWREDLAAAGLNVTPVMDRMYFHSIYFREPGGVLFEIATDPPGFATDEPPDHLGERLTLPSWLEPQRPRIELILPSLA
jgi:glyoxalase family protein